MHRAAFSEKGCSKLLEDTIGLDEQPPEAIRVLGIVGGVRMIGRKARRARDLAGIVVDGHWNSEVRERRQYCGMEVCDRLRPQRYLVGGAVADLDLEPMRMEIEPDFKRTRTA